MVEGVVKMGTMSSSGKSTSLAGCRAGSWLGEGSVLKDELRRYDLVALRDSRVALMNRSTFFWLYENSPAFNRFLIRQFNEQISQFIALVEYDRMLSAPGRVAPQHRLAVQSRALPQCRARTSISPRRSWSLLAGLSRQHTNEALKLLEAEGCCASSAVALPCSIWPALLVTGNRAARAQPDHCAVPTTPRQDAVIFGPVSPKRWIDVAGMCRAMPAIAGHDATMEPGFHLSRSCPKLNRLTNLIRMRFSAPGGMARDKAQMRPPGRTAWSRTARSRRNGTGCVASRCASVACAR